MPFCPQKKTCSFISFSKLVTGLSKIKRLSNYEVYEFITGKNIQSVDEVFFIARTLEDNGKKDLANYLLSRSQKSISDLFDATKRMGTATSTMK